MLKATTLFLSFFLLSTQPMAQSVSVEKLVELSKSACLAGEKLDMQIGADGGITLFKRSLGGVEGGVSLKRKEIHGAVGLASEKAILEENSAIRSCVLQVIALLRSAESLPPPTEDGDAFLPSNQWLGVDSPLPIIDGKARIIIKKIYESNRRTKAKVRVEVPRRETFIRNLDKGESMKFIYHDKPYILTLLEVRLQAQRAKFTVIEE